MLVTFFFAKRTQPRHPNPPYLFDSCHIPRPLACLASLSLSRKRIRKIMMMMTTMTTTLNLFPFFLLLALLSWSLIGSTATAAAFCVVGERKNAFVGRSVPTCGTATNTALTTTMMAAKDDDDSDEDFPTAEFAKAVKCAENYGSCDVDELWRLSDVLESYGDGCYFEKGPVCFDFLFAFFCIVACRRCRCRRY